jgi:hypothetical protein
MHIHSRSSSSLLLTEGSTQAAAPRMEGRALRKVGSIAMSLIASIKKMRFLASVLKPRLTIVSSHLYHSSERIELAKLGAVHQPEPALNCTEEEWRWNLWPLDDVRGHVHFGFRLLFLLQKHELVFARRNDRFTSLVGVDGLVAQALALADVLARESLTANVTKVEDAGDRVLREGFGRLLDVAKLLADRLAQPRALLAERRQLLCARGIARGTYACASNPK